VPRSRGHLSLLPFLSFERPKDLSYLILSYLISSSLITTAKTKGKTRIIQVVYRGGLQVTRNTPQELPPAGLIDLGIHHEIVILPRPHRSSLLRLCLLPHVSRHHPIQHPIHRPAPTQIGLINPPIQRLYLLTRWPGNRRHLVRTRRPTTTGLDRGQPLRPLLPSTPRPLPTGCGPRRGRLRLFLPDTLDGDSLPRLVGSQITRPWTGRRCAQDRVLGEVKGLRLLPVTVHLQVETNVKETTLRPRRERPLRRNQVVDVLLQQGDL